MTTDTKTINDLTPQNLANFYGTEGYTKFMSLVLTDGAKFVAECDCHWLLIAIWSHQSKALQEKADGLQVWKLRPLKDDPEFKAVLVCEDGNYNKLVEQKIEFTNFPFDRFENEEFQLWVEEGSLDGKTTVQVCLLPSEH